MIPACPEGKAELLYIEEKIALPIHQTHQAQSFWTLQKWQSLESNDPSKAMTSQKKRSEFLNPSEVTTNQKQRPEFFKPLKSNKPSKVTVRVF